VNYSVLDTLILVLSTQGNATVAIPSLLDQSLLPSQIVALHAWAMLMNSVVLVVDFLFTN